jgi:hypothetical protein
MFPQDNRQLTSFNVYISTDTMVSVAWLGNISNFSHFVALCLLPPVQLKCWASAAQLMKKQELADSSEK